MRPGSARRTRSPGAGPGAARDHRRHTINAPHRPISSVPSARAGGRRARPALLQHRHDGPASGRNLAGSRAGRTRRAPARSGGLAHVRQAQRTRQYQPAAAAAQIARAKPDRKCLAVLRDNWLSNRVFKSYRDIVDHCCYAWNKLIDQPWTIMSIGLRHWAMGPHH